jgi:hypothetical protein
MVLIAIFLTVDRASGTYWSVRGAGHSLGILFLIAIAVGAGGLGLGLALHSRPADLAGGAAVFCVLGLALFDRLPRRSATSASSGQAPGSRSPEASWPPRERLLRCGRRRPAAPLRRLRLPRLAGRRGDEVGGRHVLVPVAELEGARHLIAGQTGQRQIEPLRPRPPRPRGPRP